MVHYGVPWSPLCRLKIVSNQKRGRTHFSCVSTDFRDSWAEDTKRKDEKRKTKRKTIKIEIKEMVNVLDLTFGFWSQYWWETFTFG